MVIVWKELVRCKWAVGLAVCSGSFGRQLDAQEPIREQPKSTVRNPAPPTVASIPIKEPVGKGTASPLDGPKLKAVPSWSEVLRAILLTAVPHKYEDLSQWGKTNEVFDGLRVKQRGFDLRFSERTRRVNNGAWYKYRIDLINPDKTLKLVIDKIHSVGGNQFRFDLNLTSKLRCRTDFEHWILGVKGINTTIVSDADVRVWAACTLAIRMESSRNSLLPDLILEPRVRQVRLFLTNLHVRRIGEIRGDLAKGIGEGSLQFIQNLMQAQEERVLKKANEAFEKKHSSLRIPTSRLW